MNKNLFLLGIVVCLNVNAGVVDVSQQPPSDSYTNETRPQVEQLEYADVIDMKQRFHRVATRGACRALDNSGRQICEPGEILKENFIGWDVTYQYKGYTGTFFTSTHPGSRILMKTSLIPVVK